MLERGDGIIVWRFFSQNLAKNPKILAKTLVVRSSLERRQLGWEPDVAVGGVWALPYSSGQQYILENSYLLTPVHFPISSSYFLLEFSTNA